jgi:predicted TPR repeat methyltransferase
MHLGNLKLLQSHLDAARAAFATAAEVAPDHALAWLNLGGCLWRLNRALEAVDALRLASRLDPSIEVAYRLPALLLSELGRFEEAAEVYREWHSHHPSNPFATYMLAATSGSHVPSRASAEYIRYNFDRLAPDFDNNLRRVGYCGPQIVAAGLQARIDAEAPLDVLDAGCGTGLCGPLLRPLACRLVGVDLSGRMIEKARACAAYDQLIVQEISEFMTARPASFDVVVCIDTFIYFGELQEPMNAARRCLRSGGLLAFTAERLEDETPYRLEPHGRYRHSADYIRSAAAAAGFSDLLLETHALRRERGAEVRCHVGFARVARSEADDAES